MGCDAVFLDTEISTFRPSMFLPSLRYLKQRSMDGKVSSEILVPINAKQHRVVPQTTEPSTAIL